MNTFLTFCFYMINMIIVVILTKKAVEKDDIRWLIIPISLLSLIAGCRSFDVGTDTHRVVQSIEYTFEKGIFSHSKEYIYYFLCKFLMMIWENPSFVLTVFAFITNAFVMTRIWDFRNEVNISVAVSLYYMFYYGLSMNIVRQCMAVAIVFYFTRYIQSKKYGYFYFCVLIAFLIHVSSCVAVIIPVLYLFLKGELKINKNYIKWYILIGIFMCGGLGAFLIYRYASYFSEIGINIGIMQTVCLAMLLGTYFTVFYQYKRKLRVSESFAKDIEDIRFVFVIALLGHLIAFFGYIIPAAGRMGYVFKIYEIIFYGMLLEKNFYSSIVKKGVYGVLIFLGMYSFMTYGGIVPYAIIGR